MAPNYSLTRNAQGDLPSDGFRAYRYVHWLVKVATGAVFTLPAYWLGGLWWALGASVVSLLLCKSFNIKWTWPHSTWTPKGLDPFTLDFAFDFYLNLIPLLVLTSGSWPPGVRWVFLLTALYPFASP